MNPFIEGPLALRCADDFYNKYYSDTNPRWGIFGINPGRFGAGLTGVPFTDFKRMQQICRINTEGNSSNETFVVFYLCDDRSDGRRGKILSAFLYQLALPLGFVQKKATGREVNYNYYDDPKLFEAVKPFMVKTAATNRFGIATGEGFLPGQEELVVFCQAER